MSTFVLMYFFVLLYFCNLFKWLRVVKIYFHAKFRACSSKIEQVMLNFIFWRPFCFLAAILFFTFWLQVVKIYFHAKFRASRSKIERVILNFVFCTVPPGCAVPVTNLHVELCDSRQLKINYC